MKHFSKRLKPTRMGLFQLLAFLTLAMVVIARADGPKVHTLDRHTIVVALSRTSATQKTGLQIFGDNTWKASPGGWLSAPNGSWDQLPDGIHLNKAGNHGGNVAVLYGLNFHTSQIGDTGRANYPDLGDSGDWNLITDDSVKAKAKQPGSHP